MGCMCKGQQNTIVTRLNVAGYQPTYYNYSVVCSLSDYDISVINVKDIPANTNRAELPLSLTTLISSVLSPAGWTLTDCFLEEEVVVAIAKPHKTLQGFCSCQVEWELNLIPATL